MRREAGHVFVANAIWAIGLPRLPPFATERRTSSDSRSSYLPQLSAQDLEAIPEAIQSVLEWLDRIASVLLKHHTKKEYLEDLRRSGVARGQSGLSATELETRATTRKAKSDMRTAQELATQWNNGTLTFNNCYRWQLNLLDAYGAVRCTNA